MEPRADRPHMPAYGILPADQGTGLLPWSWALERLQGSHDYWLATTSPRGRPHAMPVWGVWAEDALWFSSAKDSRKTRNLDANPRAVMSTDDAKNPVVVEGVVELVPELERVTAFAARVDAKYGTNYGVEFFASGGNGCYRLTPEVAFGLAEGDFTGSPTRWRWR